MGKAETKYANTAKKMNDALLTLIAEKPFEAITVTDVCKTAGVYRSTFYAHYTNTTELLDEVRRQLLDGFFSSFSHLPEEGDFLSQEYLDAYLGFMEQNRNVFGIMLGNSSLFDLDDIFRELEDHFSRGVFGSQPPSRNRARYQLTYIAAGISSIVYTWLASDCEEDRDEVVSIILDCIEGKR